MKYLILLLLAVSCWAQSLVGFAVPLTGGPGLQLTLGPGKVITNSGTSVSYAGGTITLAANSNVYGYVDGAGTVTTGSSVPTGDYPLFLAVTGVSTVTSVTDLRGDVFFPADLNHSNNFTQPVDFQAQVKFSFAKQASVRCLHMDTAGNISAASGDCATGGSGSVTSVGLAVPSWLVVTVDTTNPITTTGTFTVAAAGSQTSHQVIGTCGSATSFAPCALVAADLPANITSNTSGNAATATSATTATTATNFSGSLGGDVTGTQSATTVGGIQNKAVPSLSSGYLHYNGTAFVFDTPSGTLCCQVNNHLTVGTGTSTVGDSGIAIAHSAFNGYPFWDVVACGADNSGTNDSTSAIQTCINNAASAVNNGLSGTVWFPCGTYKIGTGTNVQAHHGAVLDIGFFGIRLQGAGSSDMESGATQGNLTNPGPCVTLNQTANGNKFDGPGGTATGPTVALTAIASGSHTIGTDGTFGAVENNTTGGSVPAGTYGLCYTYTQPFTASGSPFESTCSAMTYITTTGATSNPIVYTPDREGNVFGYKVYICVGTNCASTAANLYTGGTPCSNRDVTYALLTHGCWIGSNLSITSDPNGLAVNHPPTTSTLQNVINILRSENTYTSAVPSGPTVQNIALQWGANKGGIAIYNHANQQMHVLDVTCMGGSTTGTNAVESTCYMQAGAILPGGNKFANETTIRGLICIGCYTGVRQDAYGSILELSDFDMNIDTSAVACTVNTNAKDNCPSGIVQMGTGNMNFNNVHVDLGGWTNASGFFADLSNNENTASSGVGAQGSNIRCERGTNDGTNACIRGINAMHNIISSAMSSLSSNDYCINLDSNSTTNIISMEPIAGGNCKFTFPSNNIIANGNNSFLNMDQASLAPSTFAQIGTCNAANTGALRAITDSTVSTFGSTIAGGGANKGLAYCDGTNWTFR